jgi:hypothetical protein
MNRIRGLIIQIIVFSLKYLLTNQASLNYQGNNETEIFCRRSVGKGNYPFWFGSNRRSEKEAGKAKTNYLYTIEQINVANDMPRKLLVISNRETDLPGTNDCSISKR